MCRIKINIQKWYHDGLLFKNIYTKPRTASDRPRYQWQRRFIRLPVWSCTMILYLRWDIRPTNIYAAADFRLHCHWLPLPKKAWPKYHTSADIHHSSLFAVRSRRSLVLLRQNIKKGNMQYFFPQYDGAAVLPVSVIQHTIPKTVELIYLSTRLSDIETHAVELFLQKNPAYTGCLFGRNG